MKSIKIILDTRIIYLRKGSSSHGGAGAPSGNGYTKIYSTYGAFAALKADGSITMWGFSYAGDTGAPTDTFE
jgi:hypothetical protein